MKNLHLNGNKPSFFLVTPMNKSKIESFNISEISKDVLNLQYKLGFW